MTYRYPADLEAEDGAVTVTFQDLPGVTFGKDEADALAHAEELLATIIGNMILDGEPIPEPPPAKGRPLVALPADTALKLELNRAFAESGLTKPELASRLGWHHPQVNRLLDPFHNSRIDQVVKALQVMGKRLDIRLEPASAPVRRKKSAA